MALKSVKYNGFEIFCINRKEFKTLFSEIFLKQAYSFIAEKSNPEIIDCGSHIGLSVLYFKLIYPQASIIAIEPDKESYEVLKQNIYHNKLQKIQLFNYALSDKSSLIPFYKESLSNLDSCGNTTTKEWGDREGFITEQVQSVLLSEYLTREIDFLKIDIEGEETNVLFSIKDRLHLVRELSLEYHIYDKKSRNRLNDILKWLDNNYKIVTHSFYRLNDIIPKRYKIWVDTYKPEICVIRSKYVKD